MYTSHREATVSESTLLYRHGCFDCVVNSWLLQIWLREMIFYKFLGFFWWCHGKFLSYFLFVIDVIGFSLTEPLLSLQTCSRSLVLQYGPSSIVGNSHTYLFHFLISVV